MGSWPEPGNRVRVDNCILSERMICSKEQWNWEILTKNTCVPKPSCFVFFSFRFVSTVYQGRRVSCQCKPKSNRTLGMRIITQDTTQWVNASLEISFSVFWLCLVFLPSFQPLASWVCCAWQSWKNSCLHWNWQCCSSSSVSYHQNQTLCSKSKRQTQSVSRIDCLISLKQWLAYNENWLWWLVHFVEMPYTSTWQHQKHASGILDHTIYS